MIKKLLFTEHDVIREAEAFEAVSPEMFLVPSLLDSNNLFLRIRAFYWLHFIKYSLRLLTKWDFFQDKTYKTCEKCEKLKI